MWQVTANGSDNVRSPERPYVAILSSFDHSHTEYESEFSSTICEDSLWKLVRFLTRAIRENSGRGSDLGEDVCIRLATANRRSFRQLIIRNY